MTTGAADGLSPASRLNDVAVRTLEPHARPFASGWEPEMLSKSNAQLTFVRPSPHEGVPHQILVDPATLPPLGCTCLAGGHGRLCWAVIDVAAHDLEPIAHSRWAACDLDEIASAARVLSQVRKWAAAARELAALRSSGYVLTERGRAAISDQVRA